MHRITLLLDKSQSNIDNLRLFLKIFLSKLSKVAQRKAIPETMLEIYAFENTNLMHIKSTPIGFILARGIEHSLREMLEEIGEPLLLGSAPLCALKEYFSKYFNKHMLNAKESRILIIVVSDFHSTHNERIEIKCSKELAEKLLEIKDKIPIAFRVFVMPPSLPGGKTTPFKVFIEEIGGSVTIERDMDPPLYIWLTTSLQEWLSIVIMARGQEEVALETGIEEALEAFL